MNHEYGPHSSGGNVIITPSLCECGHAEYDHHQEEDNSYCLGGVFAGERVLNHVECECKSFKERSRNADKG